MKKIVSVGLIWTLLFSMSVSVFGQELINILPSGISYDEVGTSIENIVLENEATTAGVAVAIFDRNRVIYENSFGYADVEN
jgi:CubicO group peptidase (beta-lactamase class C family)